MELSSYINASLALIFVLCLLGLSSLLFRKYVLKENFANKQNKRLKIKESMVIDSKRRLILIQRDKIEHLILVSPDGNLVIEKDIDENKK